MNETRITYKAYIIIVKQFIYKLYNKFVYLNLLHWLGYGDVQ